MKYIKLFEEIDIDFDDFEWMDEENSQDFVFVKYYDDDNCNYVYIMTNSSPKILFDNYRCNGVEESPGAFIKLTRDEINKLVTANNHVLIYVSGRDGCLGWKIRSYSKLIEKYPQFEVDKDLY